MPRFLLLISLAFVSCVPLSAAFAVSESTFLFLEFPPSPQANGMAGALSLDGMSDPLAVMINPASLGATARHRAISAAFYYEHTAWFPSWDVDIAYSTRALSLGWNAGKLFHRPESPLTLGLAYSEVKLDFGTTTVRNAENEIIASSHAWESAQGLTLAAGIAKPVMLSAGWTIKHGESHLYEANDSTIVRSNASEVMSDFGLVAAFPLLQYYAVKLGSSDITPHVTPMLSYALMNYGGDVQYSGRERTDPLPRTARVSVAVSAGLTANLHEQDWRLLDVEWAVQGEDELVSRGSIDSYAYTGNPFGAIDVMNDLILGDSNPAIEKQRGWEISVLDMVSLRRGHVEDLDDDWYLDTRGWSVRLRGLLQVARLITPNQNLGSAGEYIARHIDVQYSESRWEQDDVEYSPVDGTTFKQLSLFWHQ